MRNRTKGARTLLVIIVTVFSFWGCEGDSHVPIDILKRISQLRLPDSVVVDSTFDSYVRPDGYEVPEGSLMVLIRVSGIQFEDLVAQVKNSKDYQAFNATSELPNNFRNWLPPASAGWYRYATGVSGRNFRFAVLNSRDSTLRVGQSQGSPNF